MKRLIHRLPILIAIFLTVFLLGTLAAFAQGEPPGLARALEVQNRNTPGLLANPSVVGTAVTVMPNGQAAVMIMTTRGGVAGLPADLEGVPVVINVTGEIFALCHQGTRHNNGEPCGGGGGDGDGGSSCDRQSRCERPVPIGISTGHPSITAGTIGARVTRGESVFALSNNHVYAASNAASIGDAVIQPGTFDGGTSPADDIGNLSDFVPIDFSGACTNTVDAAIASTNTALLGNSTPSDGYGTPGSTTASPSFNMRVQKYGRTTGQTNGRVQGVNATVNVSYGSAGVACFVGQIVIGGGGFSSGGDSGSLIVVRGGSTNLHSVGLLFAGSSSVTIANPIDAVLSAFGVTIDGS